MPDTLQPVGKLTPISPEQPQSQKPVGKLKPIGEVVVTSKGFDPMALSPQQKKMQAIGEVMDTLEFSDGYNDDEKKYLIKLAENPEINYDTWNNAKLTVGGEHPKQEGQQTYYFDDATGLPIPLAQTERPPKGKQVESVWGSQASAEDDSIMTTIGTNIANTIPNFISSVGDLIHLPYGIIAGKEADWYKDLKNETEMHKARTSSASQQSFLDTANVDSFEDLAKSENWNFTPKNVAGNVSQLVSTVLQFVGGAGVAKGVGLGAKSIAAVEEAGLLGTEVGVGTKALAKLPYLASSYTNNLATSLEASDAAGVSGREKYAIASLVTLPVAAVESFLGLTGKIAGNPALKAERDAMIQGLVKGWKAEGGELTKESLKELYDNTIVASTAVMGNMAKSTAVNMLGEATEEVLQNVIQKSSEQIYDQLYAQDKEIGKGKYGTDVTSPQAFAEYINDAVAGAMGGGIGGAGVDKYRRAKAELQSANAYEYIKRGPEAVQGLKASVTRAMDNGKITPEQHKEAIFKIDTYQKYYDQVKDLNLSDDANRRISDLTWSNENLKLQQEELMQNPESKTKGTIPHRRLLDTEAILEANSKEMSLLMSQKIADQQTAVATSVDEKIAESKKAVYKDEAKVAEAIPLKEQIKQATTERDLNALLNEADAKGVTTPELIDVVGQRRQEIKMATPAVNLPPDVKEFHATISKEVGDEIDFNNLANVSNRKKADIVVKHLEEKGTRVLTGGEMEVGAWAKKVANKKQLPLYYVVDFGGKKIKLASSDFTKGIKEKDFTGRKVDVQLVKPTDANLDELVKEGVLEPNDVVERTDENGVKSKSFVFKADENKVRYPFVLAVRLKTPKGGSGVTIGNLAINDKKDNTLVMYKKTPVAEPVTSPSDVKSTEKKTSGEQPFDKESAEVDFEAQLESATNVTIEEEDAGFTAKQESEASKSTRDEFIDKQVSAQIEDGDYKAGSDLEKTSRQLWGKRWDKINAKDELLNNYKIYEDDTENENAVENLSATDNDESESSIKTLEVEGENAGGIETKEVERIAEEVDKLLEKVYSKRYNVKLPFAFNKAMKHDVTSAYDQVLQYFIGGGKVNVAAVDEIFGGKGREDKVKSEAKLRKGYLDSKPMKKATDNAVEGLAHLMWQGQKVSNQFEDTDFEEAIISVITDFNTRADMANHLNDVFSEKDTRNIDTTQEVVDESEEIKPSDIKLEDDDNFDITPYDGEPPVFQKGKGDFAPDAKESREKKIELLKKAIPGIKVIEDDTIGADVAGQLDADGKTIRLNPNYNYSDTAIHEFGHALIDMLGGTTNALIRKGIEQLKATKLWAETKERYPELSEDMLAKEVLAEAIGREGVNVFDTKEKQSKFKNWLDGIFYKIKRLLGIEKNVAKSLANQLLSGKRIKGTIVSQKDIQKQKNKEEKTITASKPLSFNKWKKQQAIDEFDIKERIAEVKEEIVDASGEQKNILEGELELLEQSLENAKIDYENYVADHKSIVDFVESKGDVSKLSLDELYEIQSQLIKYDDITKSKLYKDLLYNIGAKLNEIQTAELKAADPDYNPEVQQKGDLEKQDRWAQGLSTIGEKFPAIQAFYKLYRKASGEMNKELSDIQSKGQELAKKVISEYNKKNGVAERLKNFTIGGGSKYFSYLAKDGELIQQGTAEYNKLSQAQKDLLDFITTQKASLDKHMEGNGLLKSGAGFIETMGKSGLYKAYANYITNNHNLRNVKVEFKDPATGKVTEEYYGDIENILNDYGKGNSIKKVQALALLSKYNLKARAGLGTTKQGRGKYFLRPDGKLVSMFGGEFKGDFTENYYETFMKYAQDAVFSKNMSPLMPTLTGVEMFYNAMGSDKENVSKFLDVVKRGKFLGETIESGLGQRADAAMRLLRKWTSWRFIAFNVPANIFNVLVGEYNQLRAEGGKTWAKGKARMAKSMVMGRKNAKAFNILKNYYPDLITDINRIDPEKHVGRYFDMLAFGGQKLGEGIIRGGAVLGKLSTEHYNWFDNQGNIKGTPEQVKEREAIIKKEIAKYISEVERVQGRYSDVEKRNFAYFEAGQFFGQFKVWMPEWLSDRFANTYIDADGVKRVGSFNVLFNYGMRDFLRNATKKSFYTSTKPKDVAIRKQMRGLILTSVLYLSYLSASDDDDDKDLAHNLDKMIKNVSGIYNMDNNTFLISQPAAAMSTVVDLAKMLKSAINLEVVKSGKNEGNIKALDIGYNLLPANKLISAPIDLMKK